MQPIKLQEIPSESYGSNTFKTSTASRSAQSFGTHEQDFGGRWEVRGADLGRVAVPTAIKAAAQSAGEVSCLAPYGLMSNSMPTRKLTFLSGTKAL